jgi:hypothetical protein
VMAIQGLMALSEPAPKITPASVIAEAEARAAAASKGPTCSDQSAAAAAAAPGPVAAQQVEQQARPTSPSKDDKLPPGIHASRPAATAATAVPDAGSRRPSDDGQDGAPHAPADPLQQLQQQLAQLAQMQQLHHDQARQHHCQQLQQGYSERVAHAAAAAPADGSAAAVPSPAQQHALEPGAAALAAALSAVGVSVVAAAAAAEQAAAAPDTHGCSDGCLATELHGHAGYPAGMLGDSSSRCASPAPDYLQQLFDQTMAEQPAMPGTAQNSAGLAARQQHTAPVAEAAPDAGGRLMHAAQQQPPTPGPGGWGDLQRQAAGGRGRCRAGISRFGAEEERHKQKQVPCFAMRG